LRFDDHLSDCIRIVNGLVQGDPFSMLLYVVYASRLLRVAKGRKEGAFGYVDDASLLARGKTY
ncbi:hypothetical protein CONPUDRAFT_43088, partial [Coniophora puteana RWD-64-598 SS2]